MAIEFGDAPTWVAAVGTAGTLAAAILQIGSERRRRIQQEAADREERRREQARLISCLIGPEEENWQTLGTPARSRGTPAPPRTRMYLVNGSPEPVYSVVVGIVFIQGAGPTAIEEMLKIRQDHPEQPLPVTTIGVLPGGPSQAWIAGTGWSSILSGRTAAELAFTDRAGNHWIRRATGQLDELDVEPLRYLERLGMHGPFDLQTPERYMSST